MKARVSVEEGWLDDDRWAVIITLPNELPRRTLWERYPSRAAAMKGADDARAYYRATVRGVEEADQHAPRLSPPTCP